MNAVRAVLVGSPFFLYHMLCVKRVLCTVPELSVHYKVPCTLGMHAYICTNTLSEQGCTINMLCLHHQLVYYSSSKPLCLRGMLMLMLVQICIYMHHLQHALAAVNAASNEMTAAEAQLLVSCVVCIYHSREHARLLQQRFNSPAVTVVWRVPKIIVSKASGLVCCCQATVVAWPQVIHSIPHLPRTLPNCTRSIIHSKSIDYLQALAPLSTSLRYCVCRCAQQASASLHPSIACQPRTCP